MKIIKIKSCRECEMSLSKRYEIGCPEKGYHRELCMDSKINKDCPLDDYNEQYVYRNVNQ